MRERKAYTGLSRDSSHMPYVLLQSQYIMTYCIWGGEGEPEKVLSGFELGYVGCH